VFQIEQNSPKRMTIWCNRSIIC